MARIIPVRDLRDTTKITNMCRESSEPIYVTRNGYGEMVVMSLSAYEETLAKIKFYEQIIAARQQAQEGKVVDGDVAMNDLAEKYEIK